MPIVLYAFTPSGVVDLPGTNRNCKGTGGWEGAERLTGQRACAPRMASTLKQLATM